MTRRGWLVAALVVVAAAAALIVRNYPEIFPVTAVSRKDTVKVAQVGEFFVYMPLYYANERGFFGKENIGVTIVNTGGDEKSVAAVISGDATFGVGDPTFAAIAGQKGQDVRIVASVLNGVPFWGVAKDPNVPEITDPRQLKGYTVGTFPAPSTAYTLQARMFRQGGLEPSIRQAQFGTLLPLLESGQVDIVLELEPNVSIATSRGAHVVYSMAKQYGPFAMTGVSVSGQTIKNDSDLVRRFVRALDAAERHAHANPEDVVAFAKTRFPDLPPGVAEEGARRMLGSGTFPPTARVSEDGWRAALELRVQAGELPSVDAGVRYLDNSFVP